MNIENLRAYCLSKKNATEGFPFNNDVLVFKVEGKIFALLSLARNEKGLAISLKCDPDLAIEIRDRFTCVTAGYHLNKRHWNTIYLENEINDKDLMYWIDHSFEQTIAKLPKSKRKEYS